MPTKTTDRPDPVSMVDVARDLRLAGIFRSCPSDERARACHERLREYIPLLADPAETRVAGMKDSRAKDVAEDTIRHALQLHGQEGRGGDPGAQMRLVAASVTHLVRYAGLPVPVL